MNADTQEHRRRSIRLRDYDYAQAGAYFVTICTYSRECMLVRVVDGAIALNRLGEIVQEEWLRSAEVRKEIELDDFVVMPNHLHGVIFIKDSNASVGVHGRAPMYGEQAPAKRAYSRTPLRKPRSLGSFVAGFKAATTKRINEMLRTPEQPFWQRNYYEHVVRSELDLNRIRKYIEFNPRRWSADPENPEFVAPEKHV